MTATDPAGVSSVAARWLGELLPAAAPVATTDELLAASLEAAGRPVSRTDGPALPPAGSVRGVALLDEQLTDDPRGPETQLELLARTLEPAGVIVATLTNRGYAEAHGHAAHAHAVTGAQAARLLGQRGFTVEAQIAPGAAARVRGEPATVDTRADAAPGLADAAPVLLVAARAPASFEDRAATFFATLPRHVLAAAVLCRELNGRMLIVHDVFKGAWTIPGGVVEPDERPSDAAAREAWEEAGVRVDVGRVLGLFAARRPDRAIVVYDAWPSAGGAVDPEPQNVYESDAAAWVTVDEALARIAPHVAFQVRRCLDEPGGTHWQARA
ncbi:NUDIX hydrolase [Egibacter rhizosphaerae]|uniref:NUDIX hydrolase n=1 Tax=Egibacter rhizosphaerae TaxID=1670831 RepID=A0A411YD94_9ACTN|nr:NUDIX hydrolase [Egibacter rhizosphaerae]QBI19191.1 NUDIX hydrolase [Egibacter rhizosphaerae]